MISKHETQLTSLFILLKKNAKLNIAMSVKHSLKAFAIRMADSKLHLKAYPLANYCLPLANRRRF